MNHILCKSINPPRRQDNLLYMVHGCDGCSYYTYLEFRSPKSDRVLKQILGDHVVIKTTCRLDAVRWFKEKGIVMQEYELGDKPPVIISAWQNIVAEMMNNKDERRRIVWLIDGNDKTIECCKWLSDYYSAQIITCSDYTTETLPSAIDTTRSVFVFVDKKDVNYAVLEQIKDGSIWVPAHRSKMKSINTPNTVVVISKYNPSYASLSRDRWNIIYLLDDYASNIKIE